MKVNRKKREDKRPLRNLNDHALTQKSTGQWQDLGDVYKKDCVNYFNHVNITYKIDRRQNKRKKDL